MRGLGWCLLHQHYADIDEHWPTPRPAAIPDADDYRPGDSHASDFGWSDFGGKLQSAVKPLRQRVSKVCRSVLGDGALSEEVAGLVRQLVRELNLNLAAGWHGDYDRVLCDFEVVLQMGAVRIAQGEKNGHS